MKTVLIVDDEIFTREHLGKIIARRGFNVLAAATGEEAVELYRRERPDIVFLDVMLPGIDGEHVLGYIREIDPAAAVYFITGCENFFSLEQALALGARGFFRKPIIVDELVELLKTLDEGDAPARS